MLAISNQPNPALWQIRDLGRQPYAETLPAMQQFTAQRRNTPETPDEIWLLEHPPVYTQGTSCNTEPFLSNNIPVVKTDRGGQITYHGPGQLIVYLLLDIKRLGLGPKSLVHRIEQALIGFLAAQNIQAMRQQGAPGVYVDGEKIAALGLRIRHGCCYHGLSLNVDMDLTPFEAIDPCGYQGLKVTQLADRGCTLPMEAVKDQLLAALSSAIHA